MDERFRKKAKKCVLEIMKKTNHNKNLIVIKDDFKKISIHPSIYE